MTQSHRTDAASFEALAARLAARLDAYLEGLRAALPFPVTSGCPAGEDAADGPALRLHALMQINAAKGKRVEWTMEIHAADGGWRIAARVTQDGNHGGDSFKPSEWLNESREVVSLAELEELAPEVLEKLCEAWTLV